MPIVEWSGQDASRRHPGEHALGSEGHLAYGGVVGDADADDVTAPTEFGRHRAANVAAARGTVRASGLRRAQSVVGTPILDDPSAMPPP